MRIALLTTGRQDWDILRSTARLLGADARFDQRVFAGGTHYSDEHGFTSKLIERDGVAIAEPLDWMAKIPHASAAEQAAAAIVQVARAFEKHQPETIMLVGDRFETVAAAVAATLALIPVVHLHGGEETEGAFDNAFRHAVTKMSHLHLVSHNEYAARVIAMGEPHASVHVVGSPGLDSLLRADLADRAELERDLGVKLRAPVVIVTMHPTTMGGSPEAEIGAVVTAMQNVEATYVITLPNADPGNELMRAALRAVTRATPRTVAVEALGGRRYWGLMRIADAMLGNSSSGVIEAPAVGLPVVNVGDRQKGRLRSPCVLDVPCDATAIGRALQRALSGDFRAMLGKPKVDPTSPPVAERIRDILARWAPPRPPIKVFTMPTFPAAGNAAE